MKNAESAILSRRGRVKTLRTGGVTDLSGELLLLGGGGVNTPLHAMAFSNKP